MEITNSNPLTSYPPVETEIKKSHEQIDNLTAKIKIPTSEQFQILSKALLDGGKSRAYQMMRTIDESLPPLGIDFQNPQTHQKFHVGNWHREFFLVDKNTQQRLTAKDSYGGYFNLYEGNFFKNYISLKDVLNSDYQEWLPSLFVSSTAIKICKLLNRFDYDEETPFKFEAQSKPYSAWSSQYCERVHIKCNDQHEHLTFEISKGNGNEWTVIPFRGNEELKLLDIFKDSMDILLTSLYLGLSKKSVNNFDKTFESEYAFLLFKKLYLDHYTNRKFNGEFFTAHIDVLHEKCIRLYIQEAPISEGCDSNVQFCLEITRFYGMLDRCFVTPYVNGREFSYPKMIQDVSAQKLLNAFCQSLDLDISFFDDFKKVF